MTVLSLPLISFIKHYMNTSQSTVAVNKTTGYGTRRQVENRNKSRTLWSQVTPGQGGPSRPVLSLRGARKRI